MHKIRLLVSKFQTLMDVCGIRISQLQPRSRPQRNVWFPRPGILFPRPGIRFPRPGIRFPRPGIRFPRPGIRFPRPGIRNLRKAEGFIEEIQRANIFFEGHSKVKFFVTAAVENVSFLKLPIILKCLHERHCLFREIFKINWSEAPSGK